MLVLSRKKGQSIEFPGLEIVIRVMDLKKSKVQLGIEAPREFAVHRSEKQPLHQPVGPNLVASQLENFQLEKTESLSGHAVEAGYVPANTSDAADTIDLAELGRISEELARLEAQFSATAELAADKDLPMAQEVASDAIRRIEGIRRSLRLAERSSRRSAEPLSELVRVRTDVLQCLREDPPRAPQPEVAKETAASYSVVCP